MFDLKKSKIYHGIKIKTFFNIFNVLKIGSAVAMFLLLAYFIYGSISQMETSILKTNFSFIVLAFSIFLLSTNLVFFTRDYLVRSYKIKVGDLDSNINIANCLGVEAAKKIIQAQKYAKKQGLTEPNPSILLYFILKGRNSRIAFIFNRLMLDKNALSEELKVVMDEASNVDEDSGIIYNLDEVVLEAAKACIRRKGKYIKISDLLSALSKIEPTFKEFLRARNLRKKDIDNLNFWQEQLWKKIETQKKWWSRENLKKKGSIARDWTSGWTPTLDSYSIDLTIGIRMSGFSEMIGHKSERSEMERVLMRADEDNVLIVGEPGSGRNSIIKSIATRSYLGKSFQELNNKRFLQLDIASILTTTNSVDEVEVLLDKCFAEAALAGNVILILNDFDNYVSEVSKAGTIDISSMIMPYLRYPEFQFIAITSYKGLHKYIELKPQILTLFERIDVPTLSQEDTLLVLEREVLFIENKYNIFVPYTTLVKILELTDRYISNKPNPRKSINLLNDAAVYLKTKKREKFLFPEYVEEVISEQTDIPVGSINVDEREKLLNLENLIHGRVINQVEAIKEVSSALRRSRTEIKTKSGPMGTFLFLGPTGVGKTETAKALAETYFGAESKMIRFDMSEFQTEDDIKRFIGKDENPGLFATKVKDNPFSLILLDEIEKSHPNILNLFLQVLDEGYMTDSLGRKIDFKNTIIIATSNAGYQIVLEAIKKSVTMDQIKQEILDFVFKEGLFRPEFLNRFDGLVVFRALTKNNLLDIAELRFKKLMMNLDRKQIKLIVSEKLKAKIVELSYNPQFGAREMRRVIQNKVENELARAFLAGEIKEGDKIMIDPDTFRVKVI